jgi:hypothetical protein
MQMLMNVVNKYRFIVILLLAGGLSNCKDNDVWPNNFEGTYQLDFSVTQRPPMFWQDMNPTYPTQFMYGEHLDLSQNVCCEPMPPSKEHGCPWEYSRDDFEIFKKDGNYFLKNVIRFDSDGNQISFHIPLIKEKKRLYMDANLPEEKRFFRRDVGIIEDDAYPPYFTILELEFCIEGTKITSGKWKFIDLFGQKCYLKKDSLYYRYFMTEFADFKAKKR